MSSQFRDEAAMLAHKRAVDASRKASAVRRRRDEEVTEAEQRRHANIKAMHRMAKKEAGDA